MLESLVDTSLLESAAPGRYRFHDLVRLYARACAERDEQPPAEREAAMSRLLDFYLATAARAYVLARPGDQLLTHLTPTADPGLDFADATEAGDWLYAEAGCLLACARQHADSSGDPLRRAVDLLHVAKDLWESGTDSQQYEHAAVSLVEATRKAGDSLAEGRARIILSAVHYWAGRLDQADEQARKAALLGSACQDAVSCCHANNRLGIIATYQHRYEDAEEYLGRALDHFRADGNRPGEASALSNLARVHSESGRVESGVALAEGALAIFRACNVSGRLANGLYAYGIALTHAGCCDEAICKLNEALAIFAAGRHLVWEGLTYFRVAEAHFAAGRPTEAAHQAELALTCFTDNIGFVPQRAPTLTLLGKALDALGQQRRARACWQAALAAYGHWEAVEQAEVRRLLGSNPLPAWPSDGPSGD
ncbi:hypothetical protein CTZ27_17735 [Streptomyces griseocarneus]|nr:hypothetical protein CTZ27_17735 [Streptomyces griseocarneus]